MSITLKKAKSPMWRKTMLQRLSIDDIRNDLEEIAAAGDSCGYDDSSLGEYYEEYRELFNELSMGAWDLQEAIGRIEEFDGEAWINWDDCTVALLGDVCKVLGYDAAQMDYFDTLDPWEEKQGVKDAEKRLMRLTKQQLVRLFRQVMVTLVAYMDIKGSYDTLSAVVNELDERAAIMQNGKTAQRMWVE